MKFLLASISFVVIFVAFVVGTIAKEAGPDVAIGLVA